MHGVPVYRTTRHPQCTCVQNHQMCSAYLCTKPPDVHSVPVYKTTRRAQCTCVPNHQTCTRVPVYNRNALPALTRPARPALWLADACDTGITTRHSAQNVISINGFVVCTMTGKSISSGDLFPNHTQKKHASVHVCVCSFTLSFTHVS